jgi:hypothetical protein
MTVTVRQWRRFAFWGSLLAIGTVFALEALLLAIGADVVGGPLAQLVFLLLWLVSLGLVAINNRKYR